MKKLIFIILIAAIATTSSVSAQETYFGKNKVRYKDFEWQYIQSKHFDIYFYEDAYETAKFTATVMESAYVEISNELNYKLQNPVPVFVYNSHNDFQQTNITGSLLPEGVGGFTEAFKNRIVIPFNGSYEEFRHVLHHELTHAFVYDLIYGNMFSTLLSRNRLFNLPLWYAEGFAEYSSRHGWDYFSDMFVRDATINNYLAPPMYLGGFLAYKQGQAMIKYLAETYGEEKLGEILKKGKIYLTLNKAMKEVIDKTEEEFWNDFSKEMKKRYWPEIAIRKEPVDFATALTKARKDGSYFNEKPQFHPDGDKIAIFTDKDDYTKIVLIDSKSGKVIKELVEGERSGDLESLHSFVSGMSFSPDGSMMVFVAKSEGTPTLMFYSLEKEKIIKRKSFDFYNIVSPKYSPDGSKLAFSALEGFKRDIYIYEIETDQLTRLTNDRYDDTDPTWVPNTNQIIFSSDRPHPTSKTPIWDHNIYVDEGAFLPGDFEYGFYNIFKLDINGFQSIEPLELGPGPNTVPTVSPDGKKLAFISSRNGIDNIYISLLDSSVSYPVTDILTGVRSISWSPDSKKIAFSAFNKGAFDIFVMTELKPEGENNVLAKTDFLQGKYDLLKNAKSMDILAEHQTQHDSLNSFIIDSTFNAIMASIPEQKHDSAISDTTLALSDTTEATSDTLAAVEDSTLTTETAITDEGFVYVADETESKFDSIFVDLPNESGQMGNLKPMEEAEIFDERSGPNKNGEYKIKNYKTKYTPDFVHAGWGYDTFFGFQGQSFFVFSDYLGNNQFYIATDLVNTIDQTNIQVFYFHNKRRTQLGFGIFHSKNLYSYEDDSYFSDRFYGFQGVVRYPFSTFDRVELVTSQYFIDRQYYNYFSFQDVQSKRSTKVSVGELAYVTDNILWGITGPVNGRRAKLSLSSGINLFDAGDVQFTSAEFDYRKYYHLKNTFSFAIRFSGGASFGKTPKLYFLGGTTNWIGSRTIDTKVYEIENLYFADVITPLRGVPYYELSGDRYGLFNAEFRFPLIDYFAMRFPLPLVLSRIQGSIFTDVGAAWYGDNFKGGVSEFNTSRLNDIKVGFGTGMRLNLGFLLLRYDVAWSTDLNSVSDHASHYFSFGADF